MFQFPGLASPTLCIQVEMTTEVAGFPHSEISGSKLVCQLPEAYRRLLRPSSPPAAKASTVCAYSLDHTTPNSLIRSLHHQSAAQKKPSEPYDNLVTTIAQGSMALVSRMRHDTSKVACTTIFT